METSKKVIRGTKAGKFTAQVLLNSKKRYIVNEGGARSGKTFGTMQVLIQYAETHPNTAISVVSQSLPHMKKGAMRDFLMIMEDWGWYEIERHNKTDHLYSWPNGSYMEFFGLEDEGKARGPGRDILFINEGNKLKKDVFDQLDMRTRKKVIIDLNPSDFDCWCYQVADSDDAVKIHSTYRDNPYLEDSQIRVIERYREADETLWKVFGLGERGAAQETIYTHWKLCEDIPNGAVFYGLDFGYNNQTAMVRVTIHEDDVYVKQVLYKTKLTTTDLIRELRELAIKPTDEIFGDSAEPKTIEEIYRAGFNIRASDKDVTEGIRAVKGRPLYIDKSSKDLIKEIGKYKWMVDKNGNILDEPDKAAGHDHLMDAMRYAIFSKLKQPTITWAAL